MLQTAITVGFDSGDAGELNINTIKAKARKLEITDEKCST